MGKVDDSVRRPAATQLAPLQGVQPLRTQRLGRQWGVPFRWRGWDRAPGSRRRHPPM